MIRFLRISEIVTVTGVSQAGIYRKIKDGVFPEPVRNGSAWTAWPEHEVDSINRAILSGKSVAQIKEIVTELVASRASAYDDKASNVGAGG